MGGCNPSLPTLSPWIANILSVRLMIYLSSVLKCNHKLGMNTFRLVGMINWTIRSKTNKFCLNQCHIKKEKRSLMACNTNYLQGKNQTDQDRPFFFFLLSPILLSSLSISKTEKTEHIEQVQSFVLNKMDSVCTTFMLRQHFSFQGERKKVEEGVKR